MRDPEKLTQKFISITRLRLSDPSLVQEFLRHTGASLVQARSASQAPKFKRDGDVFYTLSVWDSEEAMLRFKQQGAHHDAMARFGGLAKTESFHWYADEAPDWEEAIRMLDEEVERRKRAGNT